jgi:hypothetical protein
VRPAQKQTLHASSVRSRLQSSSCICTTQERVVTDPRHLIDRQVSGHQHCPMGGWGGLHVTCRRVRFAIERGSVPVNLPACDKYRHLSLSNRPIAGGSVPCAVAHYC